MGGVYTARDERIAYSVLLGTDVEMFVKSAGNSDNGQMVQTYTGPADSALGSLRPPQAVAQILARGKDED